MSESEEKEVFLCFAYSYTCLPVIWSFSEMITITNDDDDGDDNN